LAQRGASDEVPSVSLIVAAGAAAAAFFLGLAALHAAAAMRILARDRRIPAPLSPELRRLRSVLLTPMGPSTVRLAREPEPPPGKLPEGKDAADPPLRLTVLIPAHDEALTIAATLESLWGQTRPPDRVIVVADSCTDDTAGIARQHRAEVFTTVANEEKKAGALNQALSAMFTEIDAGDVAMIMDADSVVVPEFLETAMGRLQADPDLMAVGGVFYGEEGCGLVGQLQRSEYTRYQRYISRRLGKVFVLTGTASFVPRLRAEGGSRLPRRTPTRRSRSGLRHAGDDRGQRDDALVEVARREDGLADAVPCRHGGDAELAGALAAADALAARRAREHRSLRLDPYDPALLAATGRHRLRDNRPERVSPADAHHVARRRRVRSRLVLGRHRHDLRRRTGRHRLGRGLASPSSRPSTLHRNRVRPRAPSRLRQVLFDIATGRRAGWNYVPRQAIPREATR